MEVKFMKKPLQCLRPFYSRVHSQEQTQEIRLPDTFPDIGRVLGCWGQVMIRGKEWRSNYMSANGGVGIWVMYAPEDGTQPRVVDAWIPFQCRWDFPESTEDGTMVVKPLLTNLDGRGISARKIMVRASVDTFGQAMCKMKAEIATHGDVPEDIQLLTRSYPMELPVEAGEKLVQIEENLAMPAGYDQRNKLINYRMTPTILEQKVLGNRLVFRGQANIQMMYMDEDGMISQWDTEVPFSHYTELDKDYGPGATAWVLPVVTAMELEMTEEGQLRMRGGIAAQYTIFDRTVLDVIEDAYSTVRDVSVMTDDVQLPALLDSTSFEMLVEGILKNEIDRVMTADVLSEYPSITNGEYGMQIQMNGQLQSICQNDQQLLISDTTRFKSTQPFSSAMENDVQLWPGIPMQPETVTGSDGILLRGRYPVTAQIYSSQGIPVTSGLELGAMKEPDPDRPSIILRKAGDKDLWSLAKGYGSTVEAIQNANQLSGEPEHDQILLIPIC